MNIAIRTLALAAAASGLSILAVSAQADPVQADAAKAETGKDAGKKVSKRNQVPAATPIGEPENCIRPSQIRSSNVRSNSVIDFEMRNGDVYRNTLAYSCPSLGFERRISYTTSIDNLCSVDIIYPLQNYGSTLRRGAGCGLGKFQKVELEKKKSN